MRNTVFLDAGNTRIKAAGMMKGRWHTLAGISYNAPDFVTQLRELCRPYSRVVLASVKKQWQSHDLRSILDYDRSGVEVIGIDPARIPTERIRYRTVETLGVDRYLSCLGAWVMSGSAVIVSDAGTACTIDVMDADGVFSGGVIMPGLHMMISSLSEGADGLFGVPSELPDSWPPDSTEAAIQAGSVGTFLIAWEAHVQMSLNMFPDASVWLTGGDAGFLLSHTSLPCRISEHLVFEGMRYWLEKFEAETR